METDFGKAAALPIVNWFAAVVLWVGVAIIGLTGSYAILDSAFRGMGLM